MKKVIVFMLMAGLLFVRGVSAQEEDMENLKYAYGSVVSVTSTEISISDYDYETDQERVGVYVINGDSTFENMESVAEVVIGEEVEIMYEVVDGTNVVIMLSKAGSDDMEENYDAMDMDSDDEMINAEETVN